MWPHKQFEGALIVGVLVGKLFSFLWLHLHGTKNGHLFAWHDDLVMGPFILRILARPVSTCLWLTS
jgi:hypothetical protein